MTEYALPPDVARELATELARAAAADAAPEELLLFDETAHDYWADPAGVLDPERRDEAVGFGIDAALLTPLLLAIAMPVVRYLADQVGSAVKDSAGPPLTRLVRRLMGLSSDHAGQPTEGSEPPVTLSPEQVAQVREVAEEQARALGLQDNRAALLADAIVGKALAGA